MKRRVIIADEDAAFQRALTGAFNTKGWRVDAFDTVDEVERLTDHGAPEVLIVEPNLPGCSWYGLLRRLSRRSQVRIILTTSYISAAMLATGDAFAIEACFAKPIEPARVVAAAEGQEPTRALPAFSADLSLAVREWEYINEMVRVCEGNMSESARRLGIPRQTLYRKLRKYPPQRTNVDAVETSRRAVSAFKRSLSAFAPPPIQAWLQPRISLNDGRITSRC